MAAPPQSTPVPVFNASLYRSRAYLVLLLAQRDPTTLPLLDVHTDRLLAYLAVCAPQRRLIATIRQATRISNPTPGLQHLIKQGLLSRERDAATGRYTYALLPALCTVLRAPRDTREEA